MRASSRATVWMAAGTGLSRLTGVGADPGPRLRARVHPSGRRLQPGQHHAQHALRHRPRRRAVGHVHPGLRRPAGHPRRARGLAGDLGRRDPGRRRPARGHRRCSGSPPRSSSTPSPRFDHAQGPLGGHSLASERAVATTLLRWFVPQVLFYGFISLATALLNTRRRFVAPMWVPIANNLVCIAVLLWFRHVVGHNPSPRRRPAHQRPAAPPRARAPPWAWPSRPSCSSRACAAPELAGLRWRWDPGHEAVRTVLRLGAWTFGFVVANQIALFVVLALAGSGAGPRPGLVLHLRLHVHADALRRGGGLGHERGDARPRRALGRRRPGRVPRAGSPAGLRAVLAIIIPAVGGHAAPGQAGHRPPPRPRGRPGRRDRPTTGAALAMFALGLPGFCTFLYVVRVLQAMQRTQVAFWLYLLENGINIVLAVALVHPLGVRGLALSLSVAYSVAAVVGLVVLRGWLGPSAAPGPGRRCDGWASPPQSWAVVVLVVSNLSGATTRPRPGRPGRRLGRGRARSPSPGRPRCWPTWAPPSVPGAPRAPLAARPGRWRSCRGRMAQPARTVPQGIGRLRADDDRSEETRWPESASSPTAPAT